MSRGCYIGFPPPLLGTTVSRLPVLFSGEGLLALAKPPGIVVDNCRWDNRTPQLLPALRAQAKAGKPELAAYNLLNPKAVFLLDTECSGIVLVATNESASSRYRNTYGSRRFIFQFVLLAKGGVELPSVLECDLPLASDYSVRRMKVSHRYGRQSFTRFERRASYGRYTLWQAQVDYLRAHQMRVHAHEVGLRIVGEKEYSEVGDVYLSQLKPHYKILGRAEQPLYRHLCIHLEELTIPVKAAVAAGQAIPRQKISSPLPKPFAVLLKKVQQYYQ